MLDARFYQKITTHDTKKATEFITRTILSAEWNNLEQIRRDLQISTVFKLSGQHSSSMYSSVYNEAYQKFRTKTFELEEPTGIF